MWSSHASFLLVSGSRLLRYFFHFLCLEAFCADPYSFHRAVKHYPYVLKVGEEASSGDPGDFLAYASFFFAIPLLFTTLPLEGLFPHVKHVFATVWSSFIAKNISFFRIFLCYNIRYNAGNVKRKNTKLHSSRRGFSRPYIHERMNGHNDTLNIPLESVKNLGPKRARFSRKRGFLRSATSCIISRAAMKTEETYG
jgi:hypothetical protein